MWNLVVIPQASDMIPYSSSSRRAAKYGECQIQYWLSLPLWHYFAITYNWNHLKKLSNYYFNSGKADSCKNMWSFVFKTSQRLALWVLFQVWLTQLTFPTLERKLATVFITPLILVSIQQLWNHPNFAWKWAKCFFTCRNPPCIVPRTFTSGHISSGFSNCTNFGLDRVNRQTNQKIQQ